MKRIAVALLLVSSTAQARNQCQEVSDTVGERRCSRFGQTWATERSAPLLASVGTWSSVVQSPSDGAPIRGYGIDFRLAGYFARHGYLAFDWALALGRARSDAGVNFFQARVGPTVGVRVPLGRLSLRVEGLTALQVLLVPTGDPGKSSGGAMLAIEPRVAVDWWFTPDSTLTAWAGANVLRNGDYSFGLSIGGHLRAFDGAF